MALFRIYIQSATAIPNHHIPDPGPSRLMNKFPFLSSKWFNKRRKCSCNYYWISYKCLEIVVWFLVLRTLCSITFWITFRFNGCWLNQKKPQQRSITLVFAVYHNIIISNVPFCSVITILRFNSFRFSVRSFVHLISLDVYVFEGDDDKCEPFDTSRIFNWNVLLCCWVVNLMILSTRIAVWTRCFVIRSLC